MRGMGPLVSAVLLLIAGSLTYTAPDGWRVQPAASSMRVAEFSLPHADGDS